MAGFELKGFDTLAALTESLARTTGRVGFVAGGTDFINRLRERGPDSDAVFDLSGVRDLKYIREDSGRIRIGAGATFSEIAGHPLIIEKAACLAQAASQVGSVQIRNRATLAGNVAGGSPAADSMPALTVLRAVAHILKAENGRIVHLPERDIDICGTTMAAGELITEISFPAPGPTVRSGFVKLGARTRVSIAKINLAMLADYDAGANRIVSGSIALGALGEEPLCPDDLKDFLAGRVVDQAFALELCGRMTELVDSVIPDRASRPYKRLAVRGIALDLLENLFHRRFDPADGLTEGV